MRLFDAKYEAHELLNHIERTYRLSRGRIYRQLAKRLRVSDQDAHFGQMRSIEEVMRAMEVLRKIEEDLKPLSVKRAERGEVVLPLLRVREIFQQRAHQSLIEPPSQEVSSSGDKSS